MQRSRRHLQWPIIHLPDGSLPPASGRMALFGHGGAMRTDSLAMDARPPEALFLFWWCFLSCKKVIAALAAMTFVRRTLLTHQ
jgi:hypothetical protein